MCGVYGKSSPTIWPRYLQPVNLRERTRIQRATVGQRSYGPSFAASWRDIAFE